MLFLRFLPVVLPLFIVLPVLAGEEEDREHIVQQIPQLKAEDVRSTPIPGIYEVTVGPVVLYVSADGRYVIRGNLFDIKEDINLTEQRQRKARKDVLATLTEDELISFGPEDAKHVITVFTDTSCTYCRVMHSEIDEYTKRGIRVRYALYPRKGFASEVWKEMQAVACAPDPKVALTRAKQDMDFERRECDAEGNVMRHFRIGRSLGVSGTPAIFSEKGVMYPGYVPAEQLLQRLRQEEN